MSALFRILRIAFVIYFQVSSCADEYKWKMYPISDDGCRNCKDDYLCDTEIGIIPLANKSQIDSTGMCVRFHPKFPPITKYDVYRKLGKNSVINFVGDSNTRNLFIETLRFFGHEDWYTQLRRTAATWTNKETRKTIDHTYMCAGQLSPANISISFLWMPFAHHTDFHIKRPWSKCRIGSCAITSSDKVHLCDGSDPEGSSSRWTCGSSLNSVQLQGEAPRAFIVISQGGVHDTLHSYHAQQVTPTDTVKWAKINSSISHHYSSLREDMDDLRPNCASPENSLLPEYCRSKKAKVGKCWSSTQYGGLEVVLSPLQRRRADCRWCKDQQEGTNRGLNVIRDAIQSSSLIGRVYDDFVDAFDLSKDELGSAFANDEGIHYPPIMYRAELIMLLKKLLDWQLPVKVDPYEGVGPAEASEDAQDFKRMYEAAVEELQILEKKLGLRGADSSPASGSPEISNSRPLTTHDVPELPKPPVEEFQEYYSPN